MLRDRESAFVHRAVMAAALQHEVIETGGTAVGPVFNVMRVAPTGAAARTPAARAACQQGATNGRGNRARLALHIEHRAVAVVTHHHRRRVIGQATGRFRGNAQRAVADFERAIEGTWLGARDISHGTSARRAAPRTVRSGV